MREDSSSKMMTFWEHCDEINDCHLNILLTSHSQELLELSNNFSYTREASTDLEGHFYLLFLNFQHGGMVKPIQGGVPSLQVNTWLKL